MTHLYNWILQSTAPLNGIRDGLTALKSRSGGPARTRVAGEPNDPEEQRAANDPNRQGGAGGGGPNAGPKQKCLVPEHGLGDHQIYSSIAACCLVAGDTLEKTEHSFCGHVHHCIEVPKSDMVPDGRICPKRIAEVRKKKGGAAAATDHGPCSFYCKVPNGLGAQCRAIMEKVKDGTLKAEQLLGKVGDPSTAEEKNKRGITSMWCQALAGRLARILKVPAVGGCVLLGRRPHPLEQAGALSVDSRSSC